MRQNLSKFFVCAVIAAVLVVFPAVSWAQALEAPRNVTVTYDGPDHNRGSIVTIRAKVDPAGLKSPGVTRFEVVRNSQKADPEARVVRSQARVPQATFSMLDVPELPAGDFYVARVSSSLDGVNFPSTAVGYSADPVHYVGEGKTAPVAIISPLDPVTVGDTVILSGAKSFDPNGDGLRFRWTVASQISVVLSDPNAAVTTFVPNAPGKYEFRLRVEDDDANEGGVLDKDAEYARADITVVVGIFPVNAGVDQQVLSGDLVRLKATGSTGVWSQASGTQVTLATPMALETTFLAPPYDANNSANNQLVFLWKDQGSAPATEDTVTVTVVSYMLTATSNETGTEVKLHSNAPDGNPSLAIQKSTDLGQVWVGLAGTSGQVSAAIDAKVVLGRQYQYQVVYNGLNRVSNVASVTVTDLPILSSLILEAGGIREDGATLVAEVRTPHTDVAKLQYRYRAAGVNFTEWVDVGPPFVERFTITGLLETTAYDLEVKAVDLGGLVGEAVSATATTLSKGQPTPAAMRRRNRDQWYEADCFVSKALTDRNSVQCQLLRGWRNTCLRGDETGEKFIAWYYSPEGGSAWANWLDEHPVIKPVARVGLAPMVTYAALRVGKMPPLADYAWASLFLSLLLAPLLLGVRDGLYRVWFRHDAETDAIRAYIRNM